MKAVVHGNYATQINVDFMLNKKSAICSVLRSCWDGNTLCVCMSCDYVHNWYNIMTMALCRLTSNPIQLCHTVHAIVCT